VAPNGAISTVAGNGTAGYKDGTGQQAMFARPLGVTVDTGGNLYVADTDNHRIRKIDPSGVVTTFAGNGIGASLDGTGVAAQLASPVGIATDLQNNVYVAEWVGRIRKIDSNAVVTTLAGSGATGYADGTGTAAVFNNPYDLTLDSSSNIYFVDFNNQRIRRVTPQGVVTTLAGDGQTGFLDGTGTQARLNFPHGLTVDGMHNVYFVEHSGSRLRKISTNGYVSTLAGDGGGGYLDGTGTMARFNGPTHVVIDYRGILYFNEAGNHRIRKAQ
jgi:sugar lactone lactonase YvrE